MNIFVIKGSNRPQDHTDTKAICKEAKYWEDPNYHNYIAEYGNHFSEPLAKLAVACLDNNDGTTGAHWTCRDVWATCDTLGYAIPKGMEYDIFYAVNHIYSDHSGATASLTTDKAVFKNVLETINDKDGIDCAIFAMWLTKAMYKCTAIDWAKMTIPTPQQSTGVFDTSAKG